jgi:long-chain acyl-CoA synthetase
MAGYWQRPDDTANVFVDGALRTGDVGHLDEDGYLYLVDRLKDVILSGGYNVYPRVIEEAAYLHPAIEEAIAIGIPDKYRGQSAKLFVKLHDGQTASPEEILAFLAQQLNKIEVPRAVEIRQSLPKTMVGKLSKKELVAEERAKAQA